MKVRRYMAWLLMVIAVGLVVSCNKKSTNPDDGDTDDWFPPKVGLSYQYRLYDTPTIYNDVPAEVMAVDTQAFPGETLVRLQMGVFNETVKRGLIIWLDLSALNRVGFRASEAYYGDLGKKQPGRGGMAYDDWDLKEVANPALTFAYTGKVGVTDSSETTISTYFDGDMVNPDVVPTKLRYTLISKDASVTVPYGRVSGCYELDLES